MVIAGQLWRWWSATTGTIGGQVEYQALYRKYRPQIFEDVIGQTHVTTTLAREVEEGRVAHGYLFAGPRGTGKTTTARILAKALNCEGRLADGSPDNTCPSCIAITAGISLDVAELDAASHNSVEDVRDIRVSVTTVASAPNARRVFILDEAHMLSKAAGNALLKTLEEPPDHVFFVLATTEPYKLADTIRSRTQRFDFHAVSAETLAAHLSRIGDAEGYRTEPAALLAVARHASGSVRDSLSLLEQVAALGGGTVDLTGVSRALGLADAEAFTTLVEAVADNDAKTALALVARLASEGADLRRFVGEAIGFFRGTFLAHYAPNLAEVTDEPAEVLAEWKKAAARLPVSAGLRAVDLLGEALVKLREGREERLMLELALIKLTRPDTTSDAEALLARIERLERRVAAGVAAPAPAAAPILETPPPAAEAVPAAAPVPAAAAAPAALAAPAAEAATASPSPQPTVVAFERFLELWPALLGGMRDLLGARRWALFRETEPGGVEGSTLVVHVRHRFHLDALRSDAAVASILATRAGDLLGTTVMVDFRSGEPVEVQPEVEGADRFEMDRDSLVEAPAELTDPFRLMVDELGAKVVEEYDE